MTRSTITSQTVRNEARKALQLLGDAEQLRSRWLAALSRGVDGCLRSPALLICLRYGFEAMLLAQSFPSTRTVPRLSEHQAPR
jgi:hypothetical protein